MSAWGLQPDPIDFRRWQLVDIYADTNAFVVQTGPFTSTERPFRRTTEGQVTWSNRQLSRFENVRAIPDEAKDWGVSLRGAEALARELKGAREDALLYEKLATLRTDVPLTETLEELRWKGPNWPELEKLCAELRAPDVLERLRG